jgi:hypothetical protein
MRVRGSDGHHPTRRKPRVSHADKPRDSADYKYSNKKYLHGNKLSHEDSAPRKRNVPRDDSEQPAERFRVARRMR